MAEGLEASGVSIALGGRTIVERARFSAPAGQVTGLIGPNGAGKSTLIGAVAGLYRPTAGSLHFAGTDLIAISLRERARLCAYVEQAASTEERLSLKEVVALGRIPHGSALAAYGAADAAVVAGAISRVGLEALADRQFNTLSGGEQQRGHIARALAQEPMLFLLDEATSHLDIRAQIEMLRLLRTLAGAGKTVLLAIHDLNLALRHCDWLVAMEDGAVMTEGRPRDVLQPEVLARLYGVRASVVEAVGGPVIAFDGIVEAEDLHPIQHQVSDPGGVRDR